MALHQTVSEKTRGCKTNCVTARFKYEELTAPQTQS